MNESRGESFAQAVIMVLEILKNILVIVTCVVFLLLVVRGYLALHELAQYFEKMGGVYGPGN